MGKMIFNHPVLDYFSDISGIPRGSGNEAAISEWMVRWAGERGLFVLKDEANNILIRKPASPGYESAPAVMLQGHLDMVCVKNPDTEHDFTKDPIEFVVEGDTLHADGTTLGADDGLGIALILAILDDDTIKHPELECLMTTNEEVGMLGVKAIDINFFKLKSKVLINLDAGGEGVFYAGCAGGGRVSLKLPVTKEAVRGKNAFMVNFGGLKGGHSGADIHLGRANAIILAGRILYGIKERVSLISIEGGSADNSIPSAASFAVYCDDGEWLGERILNWQEILRTEFSETDPGIEIIAVPCGSSQKAYTPESFKRIVQALNLIPCGIFSRNLSIDKVITSSNLGIVTSDDNEVCFLSSLRSSVESEMFTYLVPKFEMTAELTGAAIAKENFYSGWRYNPDSRVGALAVESYRKYGTAEPVTTMIHAGLECGILKGLLGGDTDCIAMAPEINNCHGTSESCSISSVKSYFEILKDLLAKLD